ncbi:hypothetical protein [Hyphomonas sp.]|uniref:hypothetical protein n=1 Tax=Hyphomonas sp. TaxID=87 RepID=UPI00391D7009
MTCVFPRQTLQVLTVLLTVLSGVLAAGAETAPLPLQPAPNYLGIELPLRPGERVVPTADGDCSVVVFAPHEERYERFAAYWQTAQWNGYCRFGLAHGKGTITGVNGNWSVETAMVYGLEVNPAEIIKTEAGQDGVLSWDPAIDTLNFFSGAAFSDLKSTRYIIRLEREPSGDLELGDMVSDWYGQDYLEKHTFDETGREWTTSVSVWNVDTFCGLGLPAEFKPFEKEVKKACKKTADNLVIFRREGFEADPWAERRITWLKSCPVNTSRNINDCGKLVKEALGKDAAVLETFLTQGDLANRSAARQEIIDRYAPLEAAIEEPLLVEDFE